MTEAKVCTVSTVSKLAWMKAFWATCRQIVWNEWTLLWSSNGWSLVEGIIILRQVQNGVSIVHLCFTDPVSVLTYQTCFSSSDNWCFFLLCTLRQLLNFFSVLGLLCIAKCLSATGLFHYPFTLFPELALEWSNGSLDDEAL